MSNKMYQIKYNELSKLELKEIIQEIYQKSIDLENKLLQQNNDKVKFDKIRLEYGGFKSQIEYIYNYTSKISNSYQIAKYNNYYNWFVSAISDIKIHCGVRSSSRDKLQIINGLYDISYYANYWLNNI